MALLRHFAVTVGILASVTGCVPVTDIRLFNHLPQEVTVTTCSGSVTLPPNGTVSLSTYSCSFEQSPQLVIATERTQWKYGNALWRINWIFEREPTLVERQFPSGYKILAQLEPDGSIYVVKPNTLLPTQGFANALRISPNASDAEG